MKHVGILLTNTGTPDNASKEALKKYLREFLSDKRIVQLPRIIWFPILFGIILPFRSNRFNLYQMILQENELPLRYFMQKLKNQISKVLSESDNQYLVEIGMNYGNPSIKDALRKLEQAKIDELITLPLFPQYSNTTTAASHDKLIKSLNAWQKLPTNFFIQDYADHPAYIDSLANSLRHFWNQQGRSEHLLISFHGIPKRYIAKGDIYQERVELTTKLLTEKLGLHENEWTLCYQSQFGYDKWLTPSTQLLCKTLPKRGIKTIDVICPGFSVDCLETLEEIAIRAKEMFLQAGGKSLQYCPALNLDYQYIIKLLTPYLSG